MVIIDVCCIRRRDYLMNNELEMEPLVLNNLKLDDLRHAEHKLQRFDEMLQNNMNRPYYTRHYSWFTLILTLLGILIILCYCCNFPCFKLFRYLFRHKSCCGFPSICITNHNERLELSDEQAMRLSRLRLTTDEEPSAPLRYLRCPCVTSSRCPCQKFSFSV